MFYGRTIGMCGDGVSAGIAGPVNKNGLELERPPRRIILPYEQGVSVLREREFAFLFLFSMVNNFC